MIGALVGLSVAALPFELDWTRLPGAETCPDGREIRQALARDWTDIEVGDVNIEVVIRALSPAGFEVSVFLRVDATGALLGTRTVRQTYGTCEEVAAAALLATRLLIEPYSRPKEVEDEEKLEEISVEPAARPEPPLPLPWALSEVSFAAGPALRAGPLPSTALGIQLHGIARWGRRFAVALGVGSYPSQDDGPYRLGLTELLVDACWTAFPINSLDMMVCGRGTLGLVHAGVVPSPGVEALAAGDYAMGGAGGGLRMLVRPVTPLHLGFEGAVLASLAQRRFRVVDRPDDDFRQAPLTWAIALTIGVSLP